MLSSINTSSERLFSYRKFCSWMVVQTCSSFSFQIVSLAVSWQIYALTKSAFMLGMIGLIQFIPSVLLALPAGHLADHYNRKGIIIFGLSLQILAVAGILAATIASISSVVTLLSLVAIFSIAKAIEAPAGGAFLPALLPKHLVGRGMAIGQILRQITVIAGPMTGGLLYVLSSKLAYSVAILGWLIAFITLCLAIRYQHLANEKPRGMTLNSLFAGLNFIIKRRAVLGVISLDLFAVLLGGATALLPIFAHEILNTGALGLGALRAAPSIGAILTGLWLSRHRLLNHTGKIMFISVAGFGIATIIFGCSHSIYLSLLTLIFLGGFDMVSMVIRSAIVVLDTPDEMRGRVNAVNSIFINTSNQMGEFETGVMASLLGTVPATIVGGIGTLAVALIWMRLFPELRNRQQLDQN